MERSAGFNTTEWSVVLDAAVGDSLKATEALESLCRDYWYPLYAHVRRRGHDAHAAQDLTQEFFCKLLEKRWLKSVGRERGRFRTFLLVAMDHFLANARDRAQAVKRGGEWTFVTLEDTRLAAQRFGAAPAGNHLPEGAFDRDWATAVLERALAKLKREFVERDKQRQFEEWKIFLTREATGPECEASASRLGMRTGAATVAIHRLRERYAALLRSEVARTLSDPTELEEELRYLFQLLNH